jgi:predicted DNA-binding transcriptional regulator AlpA
MQVQPVEIEGAKYYPASHVAESLGISRQTLWRWRQEGKVPRGHRLRGRQVVFSESDLEQVREFAHRLEPIDPGSRDQLRLFNNGPRTGEAS